MFIFIDAQTKIDLIGFQVLELIFTFEIEYTNNVRNSQFWEKRNSKYEVVRKAAFKFEEKEWRDKEIIFGRSSKTCVEIL